VRTAVLMQARTRRLIQEEEMRMGWCDERYEESALAG
jgi:hypothetical protein